MKRLLLGIAIAGLAYAAVPGAAHATLLVPHQPIVVDTDLLDVSWRRCYSDSFGSRRCQTCWRNSRGQTRCRWRS
jgi:hypothetical protein